MAAELVHAGLKRDAGAGGRLLKDHGKRLAVQVPVADAVFLFIFELVAEVQDLHNVLLGQIQHL